MAKLLLLKNQRALSRKFEISSPRLSLENSVAKVNITLAHGQKPNIQTIVLKMGKYEDTGIGSSTKITIELTRTIRINNLRILQSTQTLKVSRRIFDEKEAGNI